MIDGTVPGLGFHVPAKARGYFHTYTAEFDDLARRMADATRFAPVQTFDQPSTYEAGRQGNPPGAAPRPKMRAQVRPLTGNDPTAERANLPAPIAALTPPQTL